MNMNTVDPVLFVNRRSTDTSESDQYFIGIGPYADTLCRLDGGKDHTYFNFNRLRDCLIIQIS